MNLQTVITNLRNTIAGKEKMLADMVDRNKHGWFNSTSEIVSTRATIEFLKVNINELKRILADVEQCVTKDVEQSWRDNPDRMGGQFTRDEIDNHNRWV